MAIGDKEIAVAIKVKVRAGDTPAPSRAGHLMIIGSLGKAILPAEEKMVALITAGFGNSASGEQPKAKPPKVSIRMPSQFGNLRPSQARMNLAKRKSRFTQPQVTANVVDINPESELAKQENPFLPLEWE